LQDDFHFLFLFFSLFFALWSGKGTKNPGTKPGFFVNSYDLGNS